MKYKKLLALLLSLLTLCSLISGCVTDGGEDGTSPDTTESTLPPDSTSDSSADETTNAPSTIITGSPVDETTNAPADETTKAPADETTKAPADETTKAPADETTKAPADETTKAPADETTKAPADETTKAPEPEITTPPTPEVTEPVFDGKYTVTVLDWSGNGMANVIVKVMKDGTQVKMTTTKANGQASFTLDGDDYTVELTLVKDAEMYFYDSSACTLSVESPNLVITMVKTESETEDIYLDENTAYLVSLGSTRVSVSHEREEFFAFYPEVDGIYKVRCEAQSPVNVYYYGGNLHFMYNYGLDTSSYEVEVKTGNIGAPLIISVKATDASVSSATLIIERTGDASVSIEDLPAESYMPITEVPAFALPEGTFVDLDITDPSLCVVYNENDGYYHFGTADGPIVYIRLTTPSRYMGDFKDMLFNQGMRVYIYDENGEFIRKEDYYDLMSLYIDAAQGDEGVCPLDKNLEYVIKTYGDSKDKGWFTPTHPLYLFGESAVEPEMMWLFACGYYK